MVCERVSELEKAVDKKEKGDRQANRKDELRCAITLRESHTHRI